MVRRMKKSISNKDSTTIPINSYHIMASWPKNLSFFESDKYKNLYIKYIKSKTRKERTKICNRLHYIKIKLLKNIIKLFIYKEVICDMQVL